MSRKAKSIQPKPRANKSFTISASQFYSGPLPTPEMLAKYNAIDMTFANRILKMAEEDQKSSQKQITRANIFGFTITTIGMICAVASIGGLLYGLYMAIELKMEVAVRWITGSMASVAGIFLIKYKRSRKSS